MVSETVEEDTSVADLLRHRYDELEPRAASVCRGNLAGTPGSGWTVGFNYTAQYLPDTIAQRLGAQAVQRVVTMDTIFAQLRMEHMPFDVFRLVLSGCRQL